jgi:hypothetical protein
MSGLMTGSMASGRLHPYTNFAVSWKWAFRIIPYVIHDCAARGWLGCLVKLKHRTFNEALHEMKLPLHCFPTCDDR